jgi:hypothetical protein
MAATSPSCGLLGPDKLPPEYAEAVKRAGRPCAMIACAETAQIVADQVAERFAAGVTPRP